MVTPGYWNPTLVAMKMRLRLRAGAHPLAEQRLALAALEAVNPVGIDIGRVDKEAARIHILSSRR